MKLKNEELNMIKLWRQKPHIFFRDVLKWHPWEKQLEILDSIQENKETFVQSCNSAGKSWFAAGLVIWWVVTRQGKVVTTAPTWRQVKSILWAKIGSQCAKAPHLGLKPMQSRMDIAPDWFAEGLSTRTPDRFQGYHGNVLIIVDEAAGVDDPEIWAAIAGNLTDHKNDRLLAIGNPTDPATPFGSMCRWNKPGVRKTIKISAYDTPNVRQQKEVIPGLVTYEFVKQKEVEWGEQSPLFQARILGEFPSVSGMSMFPLAWLQRAFEYDTSDQVYNEELKQYTLAPNPLPDLTDGGSAIGLDVAAGGADNNAICYRVGGKVIALQAWTDVDTSEIVAGEENPKTPSLFKWVDNYRPEVVYVDAVGAGQPIYRYAQKHKKTDPKYLGLRIRPFIAQKTAMREDYYTNMKAEAYWHFRDLLRENKVDLSMIQGAMRETIELQASKIMWEPDNRGRVKIQSKERIRAKEGWSPDELEALIMSFYGSDKPKADAGSTASFEYGSAASGDDGGHPYVTSFDYDYSKYTREGF